jgi:hypothetical protein
LEITLMVQAPGGSRRIASMGRRRREGMFDGVSKPEGHVQYDPQMTGFALWADRA